MTALSIPADLWERYHPTWRPLRPPTWLGGAGGLSGSDLWRFDAPAGRAVLRAWPVDGPAPTRLDQIHRWLGRLAHLPHVAVPIAGRNGSTWAALAGRSWELARWMPGTANLDLPPSRVHLAAMFRELATIHEALRSTPTRGPSPGLIARRDELARLLAGEFDALESSIAGSSGDPCQLLAARWLGLARTLAPDVARLVQVAANREFDLQPCLRDVRPDHFLFTGDELTGVVDFGAMGVDSVATDVARLLGETVAGSETLVSAATSAYASIRTMNRAELQSLLDFGAANAVLGGARWVRWHFVEHRRFPDPDSAFQGLTRTLRRLEAWSGRAG